MHTKSLIRQMLKMQDIIIEDATIENSGCEEQLIIRVRLFSRHKNRCPICGKQCPRYDRSERLRRMRALDMAGMRVYLEALSPRVKCKEHGVIVASIPWARHGSDFTKDFEQAVTWMTLRATVKDVSAFFRIDWHTVGSIAKRVQESLEANMPNRYDDLVKLGIDETSYKKGHKYMTVVVNHETGALIWAKKGHGKEVLSAFFEELTIEQRAKIQLISADGAQWISACIKEFCPNAQRCLDPFHVVQWANEQLDEVRKQSIRDAREQAVQGQRAERSKKKIIRRLCGSPYSRILRT